MFEILHIVVKMIVFTLIYINKGVNSSNNIKGIICILVMLKMQAKTLNIIKLEIDQSKR